MRVALVVAAVGLAGAVATPWPSREGQEASRLQEFVVQEGSHLAFDLSPDGRSIVFDVLGQLWRVAATGGEARPLTNALRDTTDDRDPEFAPDGQRILFWSDRADTNGFYTYELATGTIRPVPLPEDSDYPHPWSPDGREILSSPIVRGQGPPASALQIVDVASGSVRRISIRGLPYPSARNGVWTRDGGSVIFINPEFPLGPLGRLWEVSRDGGAAIALLPEGSLAMAPAPAPDDSRIAYFGPDATGTLQLWVLDRTVGVARQLTRHAGRFDPADHRLRARWTPDGRRLVYTWNGRLYAVDAAGGEPDEIRFSARVRLPTAVRRPGAYPLPVAGAAVPARGFDALALSPDGERLAIVALDSLRVVSLDGRVRGVAPTGGRVTGIAWSPDGRRIAWSAGTAGREDLNITNTEGGTTTRLTALPGGENRPSWSPDGQRIALTYADTGARPTTRLLVIPALGSTPIGSVAGAQDLGTLAGLGSWSFNIMPQWRPDGSTLVVQQGGAAVLVRLSGDRRRVELPAGSAFVRVSADDALLYTRGNQVWRQTISADSSPLGPPELLVEEAASHLTVSTSGAIAYVAADGIVVRRSDGGTRRVGWPVRFRPPTPVPVLIRNARVVDSAGVSAAPRDLLLSDGIITRIAPGGTLSPPSSAIVIDGSGRYVIPGLIDAHAHLDNGVEQLAAQLFHGITTIRNPHGQPLNWSAARRDDVAAGILPGPRILTGGLLNPGCFFESCPQNDLDQYPRNPRETARSIALLRAFGASHVKMYRPFTVKAGARMIAEAHAQGLRVTGHIAHMLPLLAAGMDSKEHGAQQLDRTTPTLHEDMIAVSRASGIVVTPTIAVVAQVGRVLADSTLRLDPATQYLMRVPSANRAISQMIQPTNREWADLWVREWSARAVRLHRAGVPIAVGTDAPMPWLVHLELESLVEAGLTPLEAIRAAALQSARALGIGDQVGAVREGYLADLLLLDADPTADIRNTRRIHLIIAQGRVVDRSALLGRSAETERANER